MKSIFSKKIILPIADSLMRTRVKYYYDLISDMNNWSKSDINNWQFEQLKKIIAHAYTNTPYYHKLFNALNILPDEITSLNDIKRIPILTKDKIIKHWDDLIPRNVNNFNYKKAATGGSTGNPLKYLLDLKSWSYITAARIFYWEKVGYNYGDKHIALGSSSLYPTNKKSVKHNLYYFLKSKIPLNGMNMSDNVIESYLNIIKKKKIKFINGYASSIYLLSKYIIDKDIKDLLVVACIPTSEILTDLYKQTILKALRCKVLDAYGAADGGITAHNIGGFFEVSYNSWIEYENINQENVPIYITDFLNYSFPFIRYEVGDEILPIKGNDICQYNGQAFKKILGRISEIIRLENGRILTGPGFTILFKDLDVAAYRLKKDKPLSIVCEIIPSKNYTSTQESLIFNTLRKYAGYECEIKIIHKTQFQPTSSGKRNYFLS